MKTLEEIKNEVAKEHGYISSMDVFEFTYSLCDEVTKRYALEAVKADREKIIDTKVHICEIDDIREPMLEDHQKEAILNLPIELK